LRSDWAISGTAHAALLLFGLVSLASSKPSEVPDLVPVSIVTDADIARAAAGQENAPYLPKPNPFVDKLGDSKPAKQLTSKVVDKPEITTPTAAPPAPQSKPDPKPESKPEPKPEAKAEPKPDPKPEAKAEPKPDPKPETKPEPKPDPKAAEKPNKKPDEYKPDQIAELLKKDQQKQSKPQLQDKQTPDAPKYNANQIAELLDHREPQRQAATGSAINSTANLGAQNAAADAQLSQSEIGAFRDRIRDCWSPPAGVDSNTNVYVELRVLFKQDGSLAQTPVVVAGSASALGPALAESGKRALLKCQPFTMLKPEHYAQWKDITVNFNPRDLSN
jgi:outer membrane biosynthesis protein TonB